MKALIKIVSVLAVLTILMIGAGGELTVWAAIAVIVSIAWLALVGYATYRYSRHDR